MKQLNKKWGWVLGGEGRTQKYSDIFKRNLFKIFLQFYIYCSVHHNILLEITSRCNCTQ